MDGVCRARKEAVCGSVWGPWNSVARRGLDYTAGISSEHQIESKHAIRYVRPSWIQFRWVATIQHWGRETFESQSSDAVYDLKHAHPGNTFCSFMQIIQSSRLGPNDGMVGTQSGIQLTLK